MPTLGLVTFRLDWVIRLSLRHGGGFRKGGVIAPGNRSCLISPSILSILLGAGRSVVPRQKGPFFAVPLEGVCIQDSSSHRQQQQQQLKDSHTKLGSHHGSISSSLWQRLFWTLWSANKAHSRSCSAESVQTPFFPTAVSREGLGVRFGLGDFWA